MMEDYFMRGWVHGHDRMSADLDRGFKWLRARARQFVETVSPGHAPGEDSYIPHPAPAGRVSNAPAPTRAAKPR